MRIAVILSACLLLASCSTNQSGKTMFRGDQGGFRAFYLAIPEKDILYVGLFNRPPDDMNRIITTGIEQLKKHNWLD